VIDVSRHVDEATIRQTPHLAQNAAERELGDTWAAAFVPTQLTA
jgi:hypothetical protein